MRKAKAQGACVEGVPMLREAVRGRYGNDQRPRVTFDLDLDGDFDLGPDLVPNLDCDSDPGSINPRLCSLAPAQLLNLKNLKKWRTKSHSLYYF